MMNSSNVKISLNLTAEVERHELLKTELARYLDLLVKHYKPSRIYLFGSMASGEVTPWSDLDLIVLAETEGRFLERSKAAMRLLKPKVGIDILIYTPEEFEQLSRERPFIMKEVLEKGKLLYEYTG